jgi:hypothetical protein
VGQSPPTKIIRLAGNLDFGNVLVGSSAQSTLTIYNDGNLPLNVSGVICPVGFGGTFSGAVPASGSQNVTIFFAPTSATTYGATLSVSSDATSGTASISISGTGVLAPSVQIPPQNQTNLAGTTATFSVVATGTEPLSYRWLKEGIELADGGRISGAASANLAVGAVQPSDAGDYSVVVTNHYGAVTSMVASLTVLPTDYHYVNISNSAPATPYTSWATAATNIQDAIDVSSTGETVLVGDGYYINGGRTVHGNMTNRVAIDKAVTVRSIGGPDRTFIVGNGGGGDSAIRCAYFW